MQNSLPFRRPVRNVIPAYGLLFTLLISGCTVGPDYEPPAPPSENAYSVDYKTEGHQDKHSAIPQQAFVRAEKIRSDWYSVFGSDKLDGLIYQAIQNSPTLAAGRARLRAAREIVRENQGALYPQVGVDTGISRNRVNGTQTGTMDASRVSTFNLYQAQATASYDLDLFGKTRRKIERSNALFNEQQFQVADTYITLINNVVVTAITEAGLNTAIDTTRRIAESQAQALGIIRQQIQYGTAIQADATQLATQLARTRASLEPLRKQKAIAVNRLAVLVGSTPGRFSDPGFTLDQLQLPDELPVSVPAQLVGQRPDILTATAALHAATAQVGIASANLLPDIQISGAYGRAGLAAADLGGPAAILYSLGASLTAPIFEGGRLRAAKRQSRDLLAAATSDYRATLLAAFGDVANSLRAIESDARAVRSRHQALAAARTNLNTVRHQLAGGVTDSKDLYLAQSQYQSARLDFVEARMTRYRDSANLFRALGGGWQAADHSSPRPTDRAHDKQVALVSVE